MNFRSRIIIAIALVLAIAVATTSGIAIADQVQAEEARIAASQQRIGEAAALKIDSTLTSIAVKTSSAARDIADGTPAERALDSLMASTPELLRATAVDDGVTRPPSAEALKSGVEGYSSAHYWQATVDGVTIVAEIRPDVLERHAWEAEAMPGAKSCQLDGLGTAFESTRGPDVTCQLEDLRADSIFIGGSLSAGLVFAAGLGVAVFASVRLTAPVHGIRSTVRRIREGDLHARVDEVGPQDMRSLASDVNQMAAQLAQDRQKLQSFNENLQEMVDVRTQELEASKESQAQFFYGLSHDFKAPLRSINGFAGLLERAIERGDLARAEALVSKVRMSGDAMTSLVMQVMDFGNAENHVLQPERVNLKELLEQIRSETLASGATVSVSSIKYATIDADVVARIIRNLVSNAVQHGPADVHVRIKAARRDGRLTITVSDDGPGIPDVILQDLFQPFVRGNNTGSGLGLAIVQRLAAAHGGSVAVHNDGGAHFRVTLQES